MDKITLLRKIKGIATNHFPNVLESSYNSDKYIYLLECTTEIEKYFQEKNWFLYFAVSYITRDSDNNKILDYIKNTENESGHFFKTIASKDFKPLKEFFQKFINDINSNKRIRFISLTDIMLSKIESKPDLRVNTSKKTNNSCSEIYDIFLEDFLVTKNNELLIRFLKTYDANYDNHTCNKTNNYFKRYSEAFTLFDKIGYSKIEINFIKPSLPQYKENVLLTICTNNSLPDDERVFINLLLYKILSYTAVTQLIENQELRKKKDYTLTTHGLKTEIGNSLLHLSTTLKDKYNRLVKKNNALQPLRQNIDSIDKNIHQLYSITGIHSLLEKVGNRESFLFSAIDDKLLQVDKVNFNVNNYCNQINQLYKDDFNIQIKTELDLSLLELKIYNHHFSESLLKLFYGTIFENLIRYAQPEDNKLHLEIYTKNGFWIFKNKKNANASLTKKYLRGNLRFFKSIIEDTNSGTMLIDRSDSDNYYIKLKL